MHVPVHESACATLSARAAGRAAAAGAAAAGAGPGRLVRPRHGLPRAGRRAVCGSHGAARRRLHRRPRPPAAPLPLRGAPPGAARRVAQACLRSRSRPCCAGRWRCMRATGLQAGMGSLQRLPIPPPHTPRSLGPGRHPLTILRHTCYTLRYCAAPSSLGSALQGGLPGRASAPRAGHERHADADLPHHPGLAPGRRQLPRGGARAVRRPDRRNARRVCGRGRAPAPHAQAQPLHVQPARLRARRAGAPRAPGMRKQPRRQARTVVTTPGRCHAMDRSRDPGSA